MAYSYLIDGAEVRENWNGLQAVFTTTPVAAGSTVAMWGGVVVTGSRLRELPEAHQLYYLQIEADLFIGPPEAGADDAEFFNHSCEPNCGMDGQIRLVAMRDIAAGEELTFDYAMAEATDQPFECRCGTQACRRELLADDAFRPELRQRYRGYYSLWLERICQASAAGH